LFNVCRYIKLHLSHVQRLLCRWNISGRQIIVAEQSVGLACIHVA